MRSVVALGVAAASLFTIDVVRALPASDARGNVPVVPSISAVALPAGAGVIQIDGVLSEDVWNTAPAVTGFVQREPSEGAAPTHATEVRVAFDASAMYVAVTALEPEPGKIVGHLTRRDDSSPSDWVRVMIDSYHDRRSAFEFAVNAAGVKQDLYRFSDTNSDSGWDAVWDVGVSRNEKGWRAEFRIPFSQLRFNPGAAGTFGFAVVRSIAHVNETTTWPLLAKSAPGYVSSFGDLTGLKLTGAQKRLELAPYAVGQMTTSPVAAGNPLAKSPDPDATAGLDLKYKIARGLTLTGSVNPDFGQVEADPAVVNLGAFETFFAERRPFFVEGSGNFSFNIDCNDGNCTGLFYSRRIGRRPHVSVDAPANGYAVQPSNSTILGAAKVTGRVGAFSVGALSAVTGEEFARSTTGTFDPVGRTRVEPATAYSVVRASREFANNSHIGLMVTNTNRRLTDGLRFLPDSAVTGGTDVDWRLRNGRYSLGGFWAGSLVRGSAAAIDDLQTSNVHSYQRPDAGYLTYDPTRTSLGGQAGSVSFGKITGKTLHFSHSFSYKSPGFDVNDLGYQQRADEISMSTWYQMAHDVPGKHVRSVRVNFNQWAGWNFGGDLRFSGGNVNAHWVMQNNWSFGHRVQRQQPGLRRSPDARRSGRARAGLRQPVGLPQLRRAEAGLAEPVRQLVQRSARVMGGRRQPRRDDSALGGAVGERLAQRRSQSVGRAVGRERRGRPGDALRVRQAVADDGRDLRPRELHDHAEPHRADLRAAVRLRRRLLVVQGADERPRRGIRGSLRAVRVRRQPEL